MAKVEGEFLGGILGVVVLDWLSGEAVFLGKKFCRNGLRKSLLLAIKEKGKRLGATRSFLDTTSCQAQGFYAKSGYVEWGRF